MLRVSAHAEPASGSDAKALRTTARRVPGGWSISGAKSFITNGATAEVILVFAQTDPAAGSRGIAAFVVEAKAAKTTTGLVVGKRERKLGIRGSDTVQLQFADCRVGDDALLGVELDGAPQTGVLNTPSPTNV